MYPIPKPGFLLHGIWAGSQRWGWNCVELDLRGRHMLEWRSMSKAQICESLWPVLRRGTLVCNHWDSGVLDLFAERGPESLNSAMLFPDHCNPEWCSFFFRTSQHSSRALTNHSSYSCPLHVWESSPTPFPSLPSLTQLGRFGSVPTLNFPSKAQQVALVKTSLPPHATSCTATPLSEHLVLALGGRTFDRARGSQKPISDETVLLFLLSCCCEVSGFCLGSPLKLRN